VASHAGKPRKINPVQGRLKEQRGQQQRIYVQTNQELPDHSLSLHIKVERINNTKRGKSTAEQYSTERALAAYPNQR
jgi:hypothetical protein